MTKRHIFTSLTLTLSVFGFAGWFYIAENAVFHPVTLHMPLTHFWRYPHEDTFGALCFAISLISFFIYNLLRDEAKP
jgi:hypothetical protein